MRRCDRELGLRENDSVDADRRGTAGCASDACCASPTPTHVLRTLPSGNLQPTDHMDLAVDLGRGPGGQAVLKSCGQRNRSSPSANEECPPILVSLVALPKKRR